MENPTLITSIRKIKGKKVKSLRNKGQMPLHVYGYGIESLSLEAPYKEVMSILTEAGRTTPVIIKIDGEKDIVTLIREVGQNPISGMVQHVDFMKVDENKPVEIEVPIILKGEAPGIKGGAGTVTQSIYSIIVSAKPFEVPKNLIVDVSPLIDLSSVIKISDIKLPEGVNFVGDPNIALTWIQPPRVIEEVTPEIGEEGGELEEEVEGAEGAEGAEEDAEEGKKDGEGQEKNLSTN